MTTRELIDYDKAYSARILREDQIVRRCHKCSIGEFHLMLGSDYQWCCDNCHYIGHIRVRRV